MVFTNPGWVGGPEKAKSRCWLASETEAAWSTAIQEKAGISRIGLRAADWTEHTLFSGQGRLAVRHREDELPRTGYAACSRRLATALGLRAMTVR